MIWHERCECIFQNKCKTPVDSKTAPKPPKLYIFSSLPVKKSENCPISLLLQQFCVINCSNQMSRCSSSQVSKHFPLEHFHRSSLLPGHSGGAYIIFAKPPSSSASPTLSGPGQDLRSSSPGKSLQEAFFALNHRWARWKCSQKASCTRTGPKQNGCRSRPKMEAQLHDELMTERNKVRFRQSQIGLKYAHLYPSAQQKTEGSRRTYNYNAIMVQEFTSSQDADWYLQDVKLLTSLSDHQLSTSLMIDTHNQIDYSGSSNDKACRGLSFSRSLVVLASLVQKQVIMKSE